MSSEDCEHELLALESIYEDKYQLVQSTPKRKIKVYLVGQSDDSLSMKVKCQLLFELTDKYPNKAPKYQILKPENLSDEDISDMHNIINENYLCMCAFLWLRNHRHCVLLTL
ncbi:RWD domain-containing protein isoform 2 [Schistosoma japonicum]|uniref:RWD domain-containing protein isoform 2 n=2 Tax=Schistosoma japonicum TaxID=6182 RepID=A0A4Z2DT36_SCHJA|nr:RWD domain-containing protein isoform 2 [Schistosoma japonicum]